MTITPPKTPHVPKDKRQESKYQYSEGRPDDRYSSRQVEERYQQEDKNTPPSSTNYQTPPQSTQQNPYRNEERHQTNLQEQQNINNQNQQKLQSTHTPTTSHEIEYSIHGQDMQYVEVTLDPEETAIGETGSMMYMDEGIQMATKLSDGSSSGSGILGSLVGAAKRKLSGENAFIGHFTNKGHGKRHVAFAAPFPGQIVAVDLQTVGQNILCQQDAFLCAAKGTSVGIGYTKRLGTAFCGGEGFILQRIQGDGLAFIHAGGTIVEKNLAPQQTMYVDTGSIVGFQNGVDFDIQMVQGMRNMMFGGEDMFISKLTGPGKIWIQSMPYSRLMGRMLAMMNGGDGK